MRVLFADRPKTIQRHREYLFMLEELHLILPTPAFGSGR